jgi:tetratricopeptide (TPR) repeat protein
MPRPVSTGTLAKTPLAHLFVYALDKKLTGTFELASKAGDTATVTVVTGKVAKIRTSKPVAYLGPLLYEMGVIDDEQLNASLVDVAKTRALHGRILLDRGWITQEMLNAALREQTLRKLAHLFTFSPETMFSFHPEADLLQTYGGDDPIPIDPFPAIWRGIRENPSEEHVRHVVRRIGGCRCRLSENAELARFDLQGDEQTAADALRLSPMTIADLAASNGFGQRRAELLLYCMLITKQVELVNPASASQVAQNEAPSSLKMKTARDRPISFVLQAATPLTVPPDSSGKRSSSPPKSLSSRPPKDDLAPRRETIRSRARAIHGEGHYERLGLTEGAPLDHVERAFAALRLAWDPGALPVQLEDVRDDCWIVLSAMAEAHAALTNPGLTSSEEVTKVREPDPFAAEIAAVGASSAFDAARVYLARNDGEKAERLARRALKIDPKSGPALALVAWIEAMKPEYQTADATRIRIAMIDRAIEADENFDDAYYWRGQLYKRMGDHSSALRDYKRAIVLNEKNLDAVREARVAEMRTRKGGGPRTLTPPSGTRAPQRSPTPTGLFAKLRA